MPKTNSSPENVFLEFIERYGPPAGPDGPERMVREVFGISPDPWQISVLTAYGKGERRISIRACHGPGKTAVAAWLIWHMLLTKFPQKSVATAPSRGQLEDALVVEVLKWGNRLPPVLKDLFELKKNRIELKASPEESFFTARTARAENPEALQGVHSEHVLLVADEASGVPEQIFEAAAGSMSGHSATTLLLSNPVRSTGFFFDTHNRLRDMWFTVHVGYKDSPRVSEDFARDIARRYGDDSNAYRIRVLGEFPKGDLDTIIPFELIHSAMERDIVVPPNSIEVWGLDVARYGDDANALVRRNAIAVIDDIETWQGVDLMQTAGRVKAKWDETEPSRRPSEILVDSIGLGAGVVDRLLELGLPVRGINVSEQASFSERYRNLRTELWFAAREWLLKRDVKLPKNEELAAEVSMLRYQHSSNGKLIAEPKSEVKKRGHKSPNIADAFVLTFASTPAGLIHGTGNDRVWNVNWSEPVHRSRVIV